MIENIKAVSNPLTVIAIFAALAEVAGTVALKSVATDQQTVFVWFVMLFPVLIVVSFFLTLNFNPTVLYAPSDFRDEANFLESLRGKDYINKTLALASEEIRNFKDEILSTVSNSPRSTEAAVVTDLVERLERIQAQMHAVKVASDLIVPPPASTRLDAFYQSPTRNMGIRLLAPLTPEELAEVRDLVAKSGYDMKVRTTDKAIEFTFKSPVTILEANRIVGAVLGPIETKVPERHDF